jgi:hypothetical protein
MRWLVRTRSSAWSRLARTTHMSRSQPLCTNRRSHARTPTSSFCVEAPAGPLPGGSRTLSASSPRATAAPPTSLVVGRCSSTSAASRAACLTMPAGPSPNCGCTPAKPMDAWHGPLQWRRIARCHEPQAWGVTAPSTRSALSLTGICELPTRLASSRACGRPPCDV